MCESTFNNPLSRTETIRRYSFTACPDVADGSSPPRCRSLLAAALPAGGRRAAAAAPPALGVSGARLTIDGHPAFLLGVSLFDALGPTPVDDAALDALRGWGIRIVRVWAHWSDPIYGADGSLTAGGRARLLRLMNALDARGLALELVLLRPGQLPRQRFAVFASAAARLRAVEGIATALRGRPNVLFDLYNEHDHPDGAISHAEARRLRDRVKAIDPARLVTLSSTQHHLMGVGRALGPSGERELGAEVGLAAGEAAVDVLAVHLPRTPDWAEATGPRVTAIEAALRRIGRVVPIDLDEENRAAPGHAIEPAAYVTACAGARRAGAAGWVFHTRAGFDLSRQPFLAALQPAERSALEQLGAGCR